MKSQKYPKVEFNPAPFEHVIGPIDLFLNPQKGRWDWSPKILSRYPVLNANLENTQEISKRKRITHKFFRKFILENKNLMKKKTLLFQKEWDKINNSYMKTLSFIVEIDWSEKDKKMLAFVSPNSICPRNIKERWFDVFFSSSVEHMKGTAIHEILHFLYFEKWKQVFPETSEKEFNSPYLVWKLSEMVPPVILSDKKIQKIFLHTPGVYQEYKKLKIKGKPLLDYIQKFYSNRRNFEDFLKKSWIFVKKHEKEINKA